MREQEKGNDRCLKWFVYYAGREREREGERVKIMSIVDNPESLLHF
jgi:hypothetical protein